jgi:hypothetical protein
VVEEIAENIEEDIAEDIVEDIAEERQILRRISWRILRRKYCRQVIYCTVKEAFVGDDLEAADKDITRQ